MIPRIATVIMMILPVFGAPSLSAHEDVRIIGTVMKVEATRLDVKTKDGDTVSIMMNKQTIVTRDKKKVAASELKPGLSVVVDAYGDDGEDALALEVRIVPAIGKAPQK